MTQSREHRNERQSTPPREFATPSRAKARSRFPLSGDLHLDHRCNYWCEFCYFTEEGHVASVPAGEPATLSLEDLKRVQADLSGAGMVRLTYAGGEPTISPHLWELVLGWHRLQGGQDPRAMIVTNGTALYESHVARVRHALAAVKLSGESSSSLVEAELGRGAGHHVELLVDRADMLHRLGITVHLNSVIRARNVKEDFTPLVERIKPQVWKIFQFLPVPGQNDTVVQRLSISPEQFREFLDRHSQFADIWAPEDNDLMRGSYAMVDALGRFFQSTPEGYVRSEHSILEVGAEAAFAEVGLGWEKYRVRGGDQRAFGVRSVA